MVKPTSGAWRLAPGCREHAQGLIASGFQYLPNAVALLLDAERAPGAAWLAALRAAGVPEVADATGRKLDARQQPLPCAAIGFTASGLEQLGLPLAVRATFAQPFLEGMHESNRRLRLGDSGGGTPGRTPPLWGGNGPPMLGTDLLRCEKSVHAALLLYAPDATTLGAARAATVAALAVHGVTLTHQLNLSLGGGPPGTSRENFGFVDGISQPVPHGPAIVSDAGTLYPSDPVHGIAAGDLLLGQIDAHGEPAPAPFVPGDLPAPPGARDFGRNGSYLVMRELAQDTAAFWDDMACAGTTLGKTPDWVAARVVGRNKDGTLLAKSPPPVSDNDFLFWEKDRDGKHCPLGSHIRRANPRDGLAPAEVTRPTVLGAVNDHRILRRGRAYDSYRPSDGEPSLPGLLFMCLNTDFQRQFEFLQQNWLFGSSFASLAGERDPLLGPGGEFTIPAAPARMRPTLRSAIRLMGGEYFFLPSLPALNYFASLP